MNYTQSIDDVCQALINGLVIAYPTEAVFGLGCDPDNPKAVLDLCALKNRPLEKGLILIAADLNQLLPYIDLTALSDERIAHIQSTWPGPYTWVMPAKSATPKFLTGQFETIAVRVTNHPTVIAICEQFGKPIVSTSANLTGLPPAKTAREIYQQFADKIVISEGEIGGLLKPTEIRDAKSGLVIRI